MRCCCKHLKCKRVQIDYSRGLSLRDSYSCMVGRHGLFSVTSFTRLVAHIVT